MATEASPKARGDGRHGREIHIRSAEGTRIEVEIDDFRGEIVEVSE